MLFFLEGQGEQEKNTAIISVDLDIVMSFSVFVAIGLYFL